MLKVKYSNVHCVAGGVVVRGLKGGGGKVERRWKGDSGCLFLNLTVLYCYSVEKSFA